MTRPSIEVGHGRHQRGAALITATILLLVVAVLGVTGLVAASLELQMSGNLHYQERAFQAAEFAIEQAIHSADLSTAYTFADPNIFPKPGMNPTVPGSPTDTYTFRLYYDTSAGGIPVPDDPDGSSSLVTYHFVIAGTGHSSRGAQATNMQGFYVIGPADCDPAIAICNFDNIERVRTYWSQQGAE